MSKHTGGKRMDQAEFIQLGNRLFTAAPNAKDAMALLAEAQRARQAELELMDVLKEVGHGSAGKAGVVPGSVRGP